MNADQTFRLFLIAGAVIVVPIGIGLGAAGGALVFSRLAIRTRIAELVARFGAPYGAYMHRTPRLLPTP